MTARIFVHPSCRSGTNADNLVRALQDAGIDMNTHICFGKKAEIVKPILESGTARVFMCLDGTVFANSTGQTYTAPEAA